jgi:hypothetical protein
LKGFLAGEREVRCGQVAAQFGLSESATKSAVHRLRQRYRERVREEIAHTVADPAEIDTEIRYLIALLRFISNAAFKLPYSSILRPKVVNNNFKNFFARPGRSKVRPCA